MKPVFSLVIPTFNAREKLEITLASIRDQPFSNLEILVQDGNSSDGTQVLLTEQSDILWESKADSGIYDAMNRAITRSQGRFLLFLGAGDTLEKGALTELEQHIPMGDGLRFIYGNALWSDGRLYDGPFTPSKIRTKNICHQAILYERAIFDQLGFYDLTYPLLADWEFNFRCFGRADIEKIYVPLTLCRFKVGGRSASRDEAFLRERLTLIHRHLGFQQCTLALIAKVLPRGLRRRLKGS